MKIIHSSDWHLGRTLKGASLIDDQRRFLQDLAMLAREHGVQAVLVSGDVYDRAIPPTEAITTLADTLLDLSAICPVLMIPGNHDSATRLGFGAPLLAASGVHVLADIDEIGTPIHIGTGPQRALVYGIPFLEPELVHRTLNAERTHVGVLTAAMERIRQDIADRRLAAQRTGDPLPHTIVLAHAFITGGTESDSEKDVSVGGVADAPAGIFHGVDYVALGHLHAPQQISTSQTGTLRYSGSPLPYSFSEESHEKSVTIVTFDDDGGLSIDLAPTRVRRRMRTITGNLDSLLIDAELTDAEDDWIRAIITDERRPENAMARLQQRFPNAIELVFRELSLGAASATDVVTSEDPVEIALAFIEYVTGQSASSAEREHIVQALDGIRVQETHQ